MKINKYLVANAMLALTTLTLTACTTGGSLASDSRLKTDAKLVDKLDNGINLYAYRYFGDDQVFVGVMAQEIAAMPEFATAVTVGTDGFYRVNYGELGLATSDADAMNVAGQTAISLMQ